MRTCRYMMLQSSAIPLYDLALKGKLLIMKEAGASVKQQILSKTGNHDGRMDENTSRNQSALSSTITTPSTTSDDADPECLRRPFTLPQFPPLLELSKAFAGTAILPETGEYDVDGGDDTHRLQRHSDHPRALHEGDADDGAPAPGAAAGEYASRYNGEDLQQHSRPCACEHRVLKCFDSEAGYYVMGERDGPASCTDFTCVGDGASGGGGRERRGREHSLSTKRGGVRWRERRRAMGHSPSAGSAAQQCQAAANTMDPKTVVMQAKERRQRSRQSE
ncbi:hypothetical protein GGX14DRAFT_391890 [Mycena pura]|uniref:Uncharacterized protein n=1 Tax=Mycena pura TaxID=153505 RepID=A0AAD6VK56_9AGAR|nr:hypothetical protein GGX14DRAFT_391890 [Mycena pura]